MVPIFESNQISKSNESPYIPSEHPFSICDGNIHNKHQFLGSQIWLDQAILTPGWVFLVLQDHICIQPTYFIVAVAFFYSSMSVLEGKPEEAISRVKAVRH